MQLKKTTTLNLVFSDYQGEKPKIQVVPKREIISLIWY